jgi:hypothetical protein
MSEQPDLIWINILSSSHGYLSVSSIGASDWLASLWDYPNPQLADYAAHRLPIDILTRINAASGVIRCCAHGME